ncbi:MAG: hypothetical protein WB630_17520, partial [Candidatus Acidiferrales bacterium]
FQQVTAEDTETGGGVAKKRLFYEIGQADGPLQGDNFRAVESDDAETLNLLRFYFPYSDDISTVTFVHAD